VSNGNTSAALAEKHAIDQRRDGMFVAERYAVG